MANILFINPLWEDIHIIYNSQATLHEEFLQVPNNNLDKTLPEIITNLIKGHNIQEIYIISGPGSFTKMRIVTLIINSIKFSSTNIVIKSTSFFDICRTNQQSISILDANPREFLTQDLEGNELFINKKLLPPGQYRGIVKNPEFYNMNYIPFIENFDSIRQLFRFIPQTTYIQPLYIKPPHITCPKQ